MVLAGGCADLQSSVGGLPMRDLADIWSGCGCLFGLTVIVGGLAILAVGGGGGGAIVAMALVGIGAYLAWAYRTNHYDSHGCSTEYLYTDLGSQVYPRTYTRSQIGRDIPADIAARHPEHIRD